MACDDRNNNGCSVAFAGYPELAFQGPDPINAPLLSSELAQALLQRTRNVAMTEPTMRFSYRANFVELAWELQVPVLQQLAARGAAVEFCVNTNADDPHDFERRSTIVELRVFTMRDPDELTVALDVVPTDIGRIGDMLDDGYPRRTNYWRAGRELEGTPDLDLLWLDFMRTLPLATAELCDGTFGLTLECITGSGFFRLAPATIARMAQLGQSFGCWIDPL